MEDMHIHLKTGVTDINIMRNYIEKCRELNINKVLFLDHGNRMSPKHIPVLNTPEVIKRFLENIKKVKNEYKDMDIKSGIESDFSYDEEFKDKELKNITESGVDLIIGSVHGMSKADYKDYLKANLDMLKTYPLNIMGHLKLRKEYEDYKYLIEEIVKVASEKNIIVEINTSDRSRWNLRQLEYMLGLFKKYDTKYTIGSDAHKIEEVGYHVQEMYDKIDKILNNAKRDIEYTIVSRGTEKYGSKGYMGITKEQGGKRNLVLARHYDKYIDTYKDSFEILDKYNIKNVAVSRFELMSAINLDSITNLINEDILIIGFGNVGFSCLIHLLKNGYRNINIFTNNVKDFQKNGLDQINKIFDSSIKFVNEIGKYNTYIEATGNSDVIKNIFEITDDNTTIILLGTPRDESYFINPLDINRKNIKIIGAHELNGHTIEERRKVFKELLEENKNYNFDEFVSIYNYELNIVDKILQNKNNFIEVIKYEI